MSVLSSLSTNILTALGIIITPILGLLIAQRTRRPNEPPLLAGWIPYLGVALSYGKNANEFLHKARYPSIYYIHNYPPTLTLPRSDHGDIVTLYLAGTRMTFLFSPTEIPHFYRHKSLDFHDLELDIVHKAFKLDVALYEVTIKSPHGFLCGVYDVCRTRVESYTLCIGNYRGRS